MKSANRKTKPALAKAAQTKQGRTYAYLRVSTDTQELNSQKAGLLDYARTRGLGIDHVVEETASGALDASQRLLGIELLPKLQPGDILIVPELSRLGRSTADVLATLKVLSERRVKVHVVKGGMQLDDSINSKILATVLGLAAEIERDLIRQRTREGQIRAKAAGKHIGRPKIERNEDHRSKLDKNSDDIKRLAARGVTKLNLARVFSCDWVTMNKWLQRHSVSIAKGA